MNAKSLCQIATLAVSIPAGMALRGAMRAIDHNKQKRLQPSSEGYKPPVYSAIFGAVLGLVIQTVPYTAIQIARTSVAHKIEYAHPDGKTTISYIYSSDCQPQSMLEAISILTTARGFYTMATESFDVPKTVVHFHTRHNDEPMRVSQSYNGFLTQGQIALTNPVFNEGKEQLSDKDKSKLVALANYSLTQNR